MRIPRTLIRSSLASALVALAACATPSKAPTLTGTEIATIVASPDRSDADRKNDIRRKPADMLAFIGIQRGWTVLDVVAGGGYTTELMARSVGPTGRVYGQSAPPRPDASGVTPARSRSAMLLLERAKNPAVANLEPTAQPFNSPVPPELVGRIDLVTLMFNYHDFGSMDVDRASLNRAIYAGLKPGGLYVIADHSGRPGTGITESGTLHRVEESLVVSEVTAAGFRLAERGNFLRNPNDPRDQEEPPFPKDEFVLKFVKPS